MAQTARKRKVTLLLDEGVAAGMRTAVGAGAAPSQSALVERAVSDFLNARARRARRAEYETAAADPAFLEDLASVARDFEPSESDGELDVR